ncbi:MFS transporter [Streptomyces sp. NPDC059740]|uniref:MFS transporter n=1 Tax=Streptomyces sp. NPDC059740 TaxID=3346926 RepID=UPI00364E0FD5
MPPTGRATPTRSPRQLGLLFALVLAVLGYQINATMLSPALPDVIHRLHTDAGVAGLSQTLFFLCASLGQIVLARLSDFRGRRTMMLLAGAVLIVGNLACTLAPNVGVFLAGRVLQGVSAANFTLAFLILDQAMDPKRFGWAAGVITAVNGGFAGVDAVAGGRIADTIGFRGVFAVSLLVSLAGTVGVLLAVPRLAPTATGRMDWPGAALLATGVGGLLVGLSQGQSWGWVSPATLACGIGGAAALVGFWCVQRRTSRPLIDTALLASRRSWPLLATSALTLAGAFGALSLTVPLFTQDPDAGFGLNAFRSALLYATPASAIGVIGAPLAGWLGPRLGWRRGVRLGAVGTLVAFAGATVLLDSPWALCALLAVLGITYNGLSMTALNGLSVVAVPEAEGALPGLNGACIGIGASLGTAVASAVITSGSHGGHTAHAAYTGAMYAALGLLVTALVCALAIARPGRPDAPAEERSAQLEAV